MIAIARAVDIVLLLTVGIGFAGAVLVFAVARLRSFSSDAGARFALWFALLIVLGVVAPLVAMTTMLSVRPEPIVVAPAVTATFTQQTSRATVSAAKEVPAVYVPPRPVQPQFALPAVPALLWLAGTLAFLLRLGLGLAQLRRFAREGRLIGVRSLPRGVVRIFEHPRVRIPVALGYARPAILLPNALLAQSSDDDIEHVVLHELEHLRRFDDLSSLLQSFCMSLLWFNPFAYFVERQLAADREMACDEAVVRRIGTRHAYASTLWNIALGMSDALVPALSPAFASGSQTVRRMKNLLEATHASVSRTRTYAALGLLLGGFVGAALVTAGAYAASRPVVTDAAAVTLRDGTTLVVGGRNADGTAIDVANVNSSLGRRVASVPMSIPRWSTTVTRLRSGDVLVTGGMTANGTTADVELYHWRSRSFEHVGRMRIARVAHTATLLSDGRVLIAAGERAPGKLESSTEVYDPATHAFSLTADGYGRISQTAIRIDDGDVLMMGGDPGRGRKRCAIIYSASRQTYRDAGTLVRATARQLTFELPGGVYVTHNVD